MKISKHIVEHICSFIEETFGYEVTSWPEDPNSAGFYRPKVKSPNSGKENQNIAAILVDDDTLFIQDHAGMRQLKAFLDLRTFKEIRESKVTKSSRDKLREKLTQSLGDKRKEFLSEIKNKTGKDPEVLFKEFKEVAGKISLSKDHPAIASKQIYPKSCLPLGKDKILVPYYKNLDLEVAGIQIRSKSSKWAIKGSATGYAFCILNWGEKDPIFNSKNILVTESWSTACSVAEVRPNDMVVATASLNQVTNVCSVLLEAAPESHIVALIDKTPDNLPQEMLTAEKKKLADKSIPYIQPDFKFVGLTDFNDIRVKHGLTVLDLEMKMSLAYVLPISPQIYSADGLTFKILTPLGDKLLEVKGDRLTPATRSTIAGSAYWYELKYLWKDSLPAHVEDDKVYEACFRDKVFEHFTKEARRAKQNSLKRMGIYKDLGGYVLNSGKIALYEQEGEIKPILSLKPLGKHTYERQGEPSLEYEEGKEEEFNIKALNRLYKPWCTLLGDTPSAKKTLKAMLGFTAQAAYASFSDYRAHMWITGGSGAGKSRVVGDLAIRLTEGLSLSYLGATESGISQDVRNQAKVDTEGSTLVRCDELGTDTEKKAKVAKELVMTARNMASQTDIELAAKGSSDGISKKYISKFAFLFSSTTHGLRDTQDLSRFVIEDLPTPKGTMVPSTYTEYYKVISELTKPFQILLLKQAKYYEKHVDICFSHIDKLCNQYEHNELAQKRRTLTAIVAGYSIILKGASNITSEKACEDAFFQLQDWLRDELEEYVELTKSSNDLMDRLGRCMVRHSNLTKPLLYFLFDEDEKDDFKVLFGMSIVNKEGDFFLDIEKYKNKASDYLTSAQCLNKIYGLDSILKDYASQGLAEEKRISKQKDGKRPVVYRVKIPKEYHEKYSEGESEDGLFKAFSEEGG